MKTRILALGLCVCLLLSGCTWLEGSYLSVRPHQAHGVQIQSETLSASNYQQLRQSLENLVSAGMESAVITVAEYPTEKLEKGITTAVHYVRDLLPLGAYAVHDIGYELGTVGGLPAVSVSISYIHGRSEIQKIQRVSSMDEARATISGVLDQCSESVVLYIERYKETDLVQFVQDYALENPNLVMEVPQVAVGTYPNTGGRRVVELKFTYQTSRDVLRHMQTQVQRVFVSASLYVSSDSQPSQKYSQLYTFLSERFPYQYETSITPAYSLLSHGVGDSKAFASVYAAMCRMAGLECQIISGTRDGEARFWNLIRDGDLYYHVDLIHCRDNGGFQKLTPEQMQGYVWDYSAYPGPDSAAADH